jgi:hypothetical protein
MTKPALTPFNLALTPFDSTSPYEPADVERWLVERLTLIPFEPPTIARQDIATALNHYAVCWRTDNEGRGLAGWVPTPPARLLARVREGHTQPLRGYVFLIAAAMVATIPAGGHGYPLTAAEVAFIRAFIPANAKLIAEAIVAGILAERWR